MYGALLAVIFVAAAKFDGVSGIWKIAEEHGRINLYKLVYIVQFIFSILKIWLTADLKIRSDEIEN